MKEETKNKEKETILLLSLKEEQFCSMHGSSCMELEKFSPSEDPSDEENFNCDRGGYRVVRRIWDILAEISRERLLSFLRLTNEPERGTDDYNGSYECDPLEQVIQLNGSFAVWLEKWKFSVVSMDGSAVQGEDHDLWSFNHGNDAHYLLYQGVNFHAAIGRIDYRSGSSDSRLSFKPLENGMIEVSGTATGWTLGNLDIEASGDFGYRFLERLNWREKFTPEQLEGIDFLLRAVEGTRVEKIIDLFVDGMAERHSRAYFNRQKGVEWSLRLEAAADGMVWVVGWSTSYPDAPTSYGDCESHREELAAWLKRCHAAGEFLFPTS